MKKKTVALIAALVSGFVVIAAAVIGTVILWPKNDDNRLNGLPPFETSRGVNFSAWLDLISDDWIDEFQYTEQDFIDAKAMGIQTIRLPVYMHLRSGPAPDYIFDAELLHLVDVAIGWAEKHGLYLILDNHSWVANTALPEDIDKILTATWRQLATRYKDKGAFLIYEILNEPLGLEPARWNEIQGEAVSAIRAIDSSRKLVVTGISGTIDGLLEVPDYGENIVYTFHFYDPFLFTHQGTNIGAEPRLKYVRDIPFPYDAARMPELPNEYNYPGCWLIGEYSEWYEGNASLQRLEAEIKKAADYMAERDAPVLCGEYGVFIDNAPNEDRVFWYEYVTGLLDKYGFARTSWDYYTWFGLFNTSSGDSSVHHDLNADIVRALGFTPPAQTERKPLKSDFDIYNNHPNAQVTNFWRGGGKLDFYSNQNGRYNISWSEVPQYTSIIVEFKQPVDWRYLADNGYALKIRVKAREAAGLQARFTMNETPMPWRVYSDFEITTEYQTYTLPLARFAEWGAWLTGTGTHIPPDGSFDWTNVKLFEIAAENAPINGEVLIESIRIEKS